MFCGARAKEGLPGSERLLRELRDLPCCLRRPLREAKGLLLSSFCVERGRPVLGYVSLGTTCLFGSCPVVKALGKGLLLQAATWLLPGRTPALVQTYDCHDFELIQLLSCVINVNLVV